MRDMTDFDARRPFTRAQATAAGISRRRLEGPSYWRVCRDAYVAATVPDSDELRVAAALLPFGETAHASHASAARLHGLPIPTLPEEHVTVVEPQQRRVSGGVVCHVSAAGEVTTVRGLRVSTVAATFRELAAMIPLVDLVVVGDHLVRQGQLTPERLRAASAGSRRAAAAASFVRAGVDSPMETRLRMLIVLAGIPEPRINLSVRDVDGVPLRRYDLCWPKARVIVEYDGRHHIERVAQWEADLARREVIDDEGWRIVVVVASGIYATPDQTVDRILRVLRTRGLPGLPRTPSRRYRTHFPGRAGAA